MVNIKNLTKNLIKNDKWDEILKNTKKGDIDPLSKINGSSVLHIAAAKDKHKYLTYLAKSNPSMFESVDNRGDTPLHILANFGYYDTIDKILKINKNLVNVSNNNNIKLSDIIYKYQKDNNISSWVLAIINGDMKKIKKLIKNGADINAVDSKHMSPLIYSMINDYNDITKYLIHNGADINYSGAEGDYNPIVIAIAKGNSEIVNVLLDNNANTSITNRYIDTPLHVALLTGTLPMVDIFRLIVHSDINMQNINGNTPVHLLLKKYNWKYFSEALRNKPINTNISNKYGKTPIDLLGKSKLDIKMFLSIIKNHNITNNNINLVTGIKATVGLFNADSVHNIIYTSLILSNYKNVSVPLQKMDMVKYKNDMIELNNHKFCKNKESMIICNLQKIYAELSYHILPYLIIWGGIGKCHIHKNIKKITKNLIDRKDIRFIFMKITIITSNTSTHANMLIYDKNTNIMERFEPYGNVPYVDNYGLDTLLKDIFCDIIPQLVYLSPKELFGTVSFQILSDDTNKSYKKLGDPIGYCLAWTYWYLEMRLNNPNIHPKDMIKKSIHAIININSKNGIKSEDDNSNIFLEFIRSYSKKLDLLKNKFMAEAGIDQDKAYYLSQDNKNLGFIVNKLNKIFYTKL